MWSVQRWNELKAYIRKENDDILSESTIVYLEKINEETTNVEKNNDVNDNENNIANENVEVLYDYLYLNYF